MCTDLRLWQHGLGGGRGLDAAHAGGAGVQERDLEIPQHGDEHDGDQAGDRQRPANEHGPAGIRLLR